MTATTSRADLGDAPAATQATDTTDTTDKADAATRPIPRLHAPGPRLTTDLGAIAANVRTFAGRTPSVMAVVKADGFGHGVAAVAHTALAAGASALGVATLAEALALRSAGIAAPVLTWLNPVDSNWALAISRRVDVAVGSRAHLAAIVGRAETLGVRAAVHLHLDCGMARDGAPPSDWMRLCEDARAAERRGLLEVVGLMGHLPCADTPGHPGDDEGRARFAAGAVVARAVGLAPRHLHVAATAAALTDPRTHYTMCRIGAGLVGIDPSGTTRLRPAQTLTAPVVAVRRIPPGAGVGYGHTWVASAPTTLATLPLGYADGLPRIASGQAFVDIGGRACPIVGRISMDQCVADVTGLAVRLGETATIWGGSGPSAADWAGWAGSIEHEIVTGVGARVTRHTTGGH